MISSNDCDVTIQTEYGDYEKKSHEYDTDFRALKSTNIIYLKKGKQNILVSVSGIVCRKGNQTWNCSLFSSMPFEMFSLQTFWTLIRTKCDRLGVSIENDDGENKYFKELFELKTYKKDIDVSYQKKFIEVKDFIPSFYVPKEYAVDILEKTMDIAGSAVLTLSHNKINNIKPDILYTISRVEDVKPTQETIENTEKLNLKRTIKEIKEELQTNIKNWLRQSKSEYLRLVADEVDDGKDVDNINLLNNKYILENVVNKIKNYFEVKFEDIRNKNKQFCEAILKDTAMLTIKFKHTLIFDKLYQELIDLIDKNLNIYAIDHEHNIKEGYKIQTGVRPESTNHSKKPLSQTNLEPSYEVRHTNIIINVTISILLFIIEYFLIIIAGLLLTLLEYFILQSKSPLSFLTTQLTSLFPTIDSIYILLFSGIISITLNAVFVYSLCLLVSFIFRSRRLGNKNFR